MTNMLSRARDLLGLEAPPVAREPARIFTLPHALTIDPAAITKNIAEAAKEEAAKMEPLSSVTDTFRASLTKHRIELEEEIERINGQQAEADAEHAAQLARLEDERAARIATHSDLTEGNNERLADIARTLRGITAADEATDPAPAAPVQHSEPDEAPTPVIKLRSAPAPAPAAAAPATEAAQ